MTSQARHTRTTTQKPRVPAQTPPAPIAEDRIWPEVDPQTAFKAWLEAIADAAGKQTGGSGWVALAKRVSDVADTWDTDADRIASGNTKTHSTKADDLHDHAERLRNAYKDAAKTYRNWPTRGLPRTATVETAKALTTVANQLEITPPHNVGRWTDFPVLMDTLMAGFRAPADGPSGSKKQALAVRGHNIADLLTLEPTTANTLPLGQLQLGSSRCGGDIPHYVPRDIDTVLADRLNDPETHLVVLVGPPKAGKTRTLVHALTAARPDALIWWANSAPGMLPKLVEKAEREIRGDGGNTLLDQDTDLLVVLDDLHRCGTTPGSGLTTALLTRLMKVATVAATLHEEPLARWRTETLDHTGHGEGATPGLADLLDQHRINLQSELNADEESQADTILKDQLRDTAVGADRSGRPHQLRRLGEYLASVDALAAKAQSMKAAGSYQQALLTAACDAAVIAPAGVSTRLLSTLTEWEFTATSPTQMWSQQQYEAALAQATTPLAPGSPHAVIVTTPDGKGYALMDAVAARLDLAGWDMTRLLPHASELSTSSCVRAGIHIKDAVSTRDALQWFQLAADRGNGAAVFYAGLCLDELGERNEARDAYQRAAAKGISEAMINLSVMLDQDGDEEGRDQWLRKASRRGNAEAAYRIGMFEENRGHPRKRDRWFEKAARRGHGKAAYRRWLFEITKNGRPGPDFEVGVDIELLSRAAEAGVPEAIGFYALHLIEQGDEKAARVWDAKAPRYFWGDGPEDESRLVISAIILAQWFGDTDEESRKQQIHLIKVGLEYDRYSELMCQFASRQTWRFRNEGVVLAPELIELLHTHYRIQELYADLIVKSMTQDELDNGPEMSLIEELHQISMLLLERVIYALEHRGYEFAALETRAHAATLSGYYVSCELTHVWGEIPEGDPDLWVSYRGEVFETAWLRKAIRRYQRFLHEDDIKISNFDIINSLVEYSSTYFCENLFSIHTGKHIVKSSSDNPEGPRAAIEGLWDDSYSPESYPKFYSSGRNKREYAHDEELPEHAEGFWEATRLFSDVSDEELLRRIWYIRKWIVDPEVSKSKDDVLAELIQCYGMLGGESAVDGLKKWYVDRVVGDEEF